MRTLKALVGCFVMVAVFAGIGYAGTIKEADAVRAIVGEAENQGYKGMVAVAEAIRNRGSLRGVYGLTRDLSGMSPRVRRKLFAMASRAWAESRSTNLVHGADHWENVEQFGFPKWAGGMKRTGKIGAHTFFKAV